MNQFVPCESQILKNQVSVLHFYLCESFHLLSCPFSHLIIIFSRINKGCTQYTGTMWFCDSAIVNFRYYPPTRRMKQQISLSYGWGENQGKKQDWLNASHFAKCSSGQYITRKRTDRLRKRTERHQWSIVCSQGAPSNSSGSRYIKETKIYYTICPEIFYKYKLRHLYFFGLIKALRAVMYPSKYVWEHTHTHTVLPPKVWNLSKPPLQLPFIAGKMHYLCAVKWTLCYSYKARSLPHCALYSIYPVTRLHQYCLTDYDRY